MGLCYFTGMQTSSISSLYWNRRVAFNNTGDWASAWHRGKWGAGGGAPQHEHASQIHRNPSVYYGGGPPFQGWGFLYHIYVHIFNILFLFFKKDSQLHTLHTTPTLERPGGFQTYLRSHCFQSATQYSSCGENAVPWERGRGHRSLTWRHARGSRRRFRLSADLKPGSEFPGLTPASHKMENVCTDWREPEPRPLPLRGDSALLLHEQTHFLTHSFLSSLL